MISLRVFFFVTLAVRGLAYVRADSGWRSPMNFYYKYEDTLNIDIILQNVPPRATHYTIFVNTDNCHHNIRTEKTYEQQGPQCNVQVRSGTIPTYGTIYIRVTQKLDRRSVRLFIELCNSNSLCSTKIIMDGVPDEHADQFDNRFRTVCLNQYYSPCKMYVDFGNKFEDKINCTQSNGRLTCKSSDEELPEDTVHQWYELHGDGSPIGTIPPVKGKKSTFIFSFLKFDNSAYISKKEWLLGRFKIPANEYKEYEITNKKTYAELEQVKFTCPNNAHSQIGWIDPTGYKITTYNVTSYSWRFREMANNSMLCCLHYSTYNGNVERTVDGITLYIYKEPVKQDNVQVSTPRDEEVRPTEVTLSISSTSQSPKKTEIPGSLEPEAPQSSTPAEKPLDQQHIETQTKTFDKTKYYIGIASVAGIIILISLIYVVIKKCYRKSSDPEQTLELETYASTNMVLYAELDIKPGNAPPPASTGDPTYAEIIGVITPQNENIKK